MMDVCAEVAPLVQPGEDPIHFGSKVGQTDADAVGGCAVQGKAILSARLDANWPPGRDAMATARQMDVRSDPDGVAQSGGSLGQGLQARGVDAVVIGQKELHSFILRA